MVVGTSSHPTITQFSSTADPAPSFTPRRYDRTTAPCARTDPSPARASPRTTAVLAISTRRSRERGADPGPALIGSRTLVARLPRWETADGCDALPARPQTAPSKRTDVTTARPVWPAIVTL